MPGEATVQKAILEALEPGQCLTMDEVHDRSDLSRHQIGQAVGGLIMRKYVERVERGCYQLTPEGLAARDKNIPLTSGPNKPHTGQWRSLKNTFRARLWRAMRILESFTLADLIMMAADGTERNARNNVQRYVRALCLAKYMARLPRRVPGTALTSNGHPVYLLVKNTGRKAPIIKIRSGQIFDPNTGETIDLPGKKQGGQP